MTYSELEISVASFLIFDSLIFFLEILDTNPFFFFDLDCLPGSASTLSFHSSDPSESFLLRLFLDGEKSCSS